MNRSFNQTLIEAVEQTLRETELLKRLGYKKAEIILQLIIAENIPGGFDV